MINRINIGVLKTKNQNCPIGRFADRSGQNNNRQRLLPPTLKRAVEKISIRTTMLCSLLNLLNCVSMYNSPANLERTTIAATKPTNQQKSGLMISDREEAIAAIRSDQRNFMKIDEKLAKNREFVLAAVKENGLVLVFAEQRFSEDREIVLAAVQNNWEVIKYQYIPDEIKRDQEIIEAAVFGGGSGGFPYTAFPDPILKSREIMEGNSRFSQLVFMSDADNRRYRLQLKSFERLPEGRSQLIGKMIEPSDRSNRQLVMRVLETEGLALAYAHQDLRRDREVVLTAVKQNPRALNYADRALRQDKTFQAACFEIAFFSYFYMIEPSEQITREYERIINELKSLDIWAAERFFDLSRKALEQVIKTRRDDQPDGRPLALIFYPRREGGAFVYVPYYQQLIRQGYRVKYYEVGREDGFYQGVMMSGSTQQIAMLVIAGHGDLDSLRLYGLLGKDKESSDPSFRTESMMLDPSDQEELAALEKYLVPEAKVVLYSCSTGAGEGGIVNPANMIAESLKRPVFSPTKDVFGFSLNFGTKGLLEGVEYICKKGEQCDTHIAKPGGLSAPAAVLSQYSINSIFP